MCFNILYIILLICIGGSFGCLAKNTTGGSNIKKRNGIATAFIAVPFTASFIKLDYKNLFVTNFLKMTPPVGEQWNNISDFSGFIEHSLMLVSIAGISSYIGVAILDNIADKVLKKDLDNVRYEVDRNHQELEHKLKESEEKIDKLNAYEAVRVAKSQDDLATRNKKFNEALKYIEKYNDVSLHYEMLVLKACIYKCLGDIRKSLDIINLILESRTPDPVLLFNKGCYEYLLLENKNNTKEKEKIKDIIIQSLSISCLPDDKERQIRIRKKVVEKKEPDIEGLFSDKELEVIRSDFSL